jgi:hypothetical protein
MRIAAPPGGEFYPVHVFLEVLVAVNGTHWKAWLLQHGRSRQRARAEAAAASLPPDRSGETVRGS